MDYNQIKKRAEEERFNFEKSRQYADDDFALDIVDFAQSYGFSVYSSNLDNESGIVLISEEGLENFEGEKKVIVVDSKDSGVRKRFTIAHELAHYFLHLNDSQKNYVAYRDDKTMIKSRVEKEADFFASNLLMPESKVRAAVRALRATTGGASTQKLVQFISNIFLVSPSASTVRLQQLDLIG